MISADGTFIEELPAHLCMSLDVYEESGALHFVSRAYYFAIPIPGTQLVAGLSCTRCGFPREARTWSTLTSGRGGSDSR